MDTLSADLIARLRAAGLDVVVIDGWLARGRPGPFDPVGVLNHHTGASARGWTLIKELAYAKWMFLTGRADLPAPLCQIALGRSNRVYVGAAGRANHGGTARAAGTVSAGDANTLYIGIEWMLSGTEPIPEEMMETAAILNAVLLEFETKTSVQTVSCHYNTSVTGKWDIGDPNGVFYNGSKVLDVPKFRKRVQAERDRLYTKKPGPDRIANILAHAPLARLGGDAGQDLWDEWEATIRTQGNENVRDGVTTTYTLDTNKRDGMPRLGPGLRRIGGKGIDLIAKRTAPNGAKASVIKRRMVDLHIDGHECYGVRLKVKFPSGKTAKYWLVVANLGRGVSEDVFRRSVQRIYKAFGDRAIYNFMEVDEADKPDENKIIQSILTVEKFKYVNKGRLVQTLVGRKAPVKVVDTTVRLASPGMAKVSPPRQLVQTVVAPK